MGAEREPVAARRKRAFGALQKMADCENLNPFTVEEWIERDYAPNPPRNIGKIVATAPNGQKFGITYELDD